MIKSKTPLRITFVGGGTDIPVFYQILGGAVVNAAIDKYITVTVKRHYAHPRSLHSDTVRAALEYVGVSEVYVEIEKDCSVQGLGTSSAICVGLLKALYAFQGISVTPAELAEHAYTLERKILGRPGGKQDHYAAAFGGINHFGFDPDTEDVEVCPQMKLLEPEYLMLFDTGLVRDRANESPHDYLDVEQLIIISSLTMPFLHAWEHHNLELMGILLSAAWSVKKQTHPHITTDRIDAIYNTALRAGAYGGKLLGGGGGGCFLFIAPLDTHESIKAELLRLGTKHIPFTFELKGSHIINDTDISRQSPDSDRAVESKRS